MNFITYIDKPDFLLSGKMLNEALSYLENKLDDLSIKEPDTDGYRYEKWEERYSDLEEIKDVLENITNEVDIEAKKDLFEELQCLALFYQITWGGLKR